MGKCLVLCGISHNSLVGIDKRINWFARLFGRPIHKEPPLTFLSPIQLHKCAHVALLSKGNQLGSYNAQPSRKAMCEICGST
jgi:hypothetical protein